MDLWHQISFEIPGLHSMLLFVAFSSFSPEVKAQLQWVLQDCVRSLLPLSRLIYTQSYDRTECPEIADVQAHSALRSGALWACRLAISGMRRRPCNKV